MPTPTSCNHCVEFLFSRQIDIVVIFKCVVSWVCKSSEIDAREERYNQVIRRDIVKKRGLTIISGFNSDKQIIRMVGFTEVVLYVVVFRRYSEFDELVFERATLFKKRCTFPFISIKLFFKTVSTVNPLARY